MNGIYSAIQQKDKKALGKYTEKVRGDFIKNWFEKKQHDFQELLLANIQKNIRLRNLYGNELDKISFHLGELEGMTLVFKELHRAEEEKREIVFSVACQSKKTAEILQCLYEHNGGTGMRHGELAETVGQTDSALSNIMKRILQSGAVEASRTGRNTFYTLTTAGERFCLEQSKKRELAETETINLILKKIEPLVASKIQEAYCLRPGDEFIHVCDDGSNDKLKVSRMLMFNDEKYVEFEKNSKMQDYSHREDEYEQIYFTNEENKQMGALCV